MTKRTSPGLILEKRSGAFRPVSQFDAEQMAAFPDGVEFDAKPRTRRSNPQNRLYWSLLAQMIEATWLRDKWPTSAHLHDALLRELGYVHVEFDLSGKPYLARDSASFDAMDADAFRRYFDAAMARLAELTGVDPLASSSSLHTQREDAAA
jgi:hypothetical protein